MGFEPMTYTGAMLDKLWVHVAVPVAVVVLDSAGSSSGGSRSGAAVKVSTAVEGINTYFKTLSIMLLLSF